MTWNWSVRSHSHCGAWPLCDSVHFLGLNCHVSGAVRLALRVYVYTGSVLQELCVYLGLVDLESVAHFPAEMEAFRAVLLKVDEYHRIRLKLSAEMADNSNVVKALVQRLCVCVCVCVFVCVCVCKHV
jgi:hypothetical protein